jgi:hypothetical protein
MAKPNLGIMDSGKRLMDEIASRIRTDRRSETRSITFFRPVVIDVGAYSGFCLMRNLSPGGMMGVAYAQLPLNHEIKVRFGDQKVVKGIIAWSDLERFGVKFLEPVDIFGLWDRRADLASVP